MTDQPGDKWKEVPVAYFKKLAQQSCLESEINDMII